MKKKNLIKQIEELEQQNNMLTVSNRKYGEIQFDLKLQVKNLQEANRLLQKELVNLRTKVSSIQNIKQSETSS